MKIYLAARFSRRFELISFAKRLEALGHTITSRWLYEHAEKYDNLNSEEYIDKRAQFAQEDVDDVLSADCVISYTESSKPATRGGRHVEFGIGLATQKRLIVIGGRENIFHFLPSIEIYPDENECIQALIHKS